MKVETSRFGCIEVDEDKIIYFPWGIPGFEDLKKYFLVPVNENPFFTWLQSFDDPNVAFLLVDPFLFFEGYEVELTEDVKKELEIEDRKDIIIQAVTNIPKTGVENATANLVGPIVINVRKRLGRQVILQDVPYGIKHLLFPKKKEGDRRIAAG
ncbi:MAG TPA: flagellar assembly protein FliW [Peptococcaceae bacterium]|nr:MAG: Flagellar assembly factor FliW [Clostridia bacterium 41_269]HBT20194.1 flagellar assembly protein FliW [Peptococcaceae bacterium]